MSLANFAGTWTNWQKWVSLGDTVSTPQQGYGKVFDLKPFRSLKYAFKSGKWWKSMSKLNFEPELLIFKVCQVTCVNVYNVGHMC